MHSAPDPSQVHPNPAGTRLETILTSEATLVPFPAGQYRIAVGGMDHPSKNVANTFFPAVLVTVLPGCRQTSRLEAGDGSTAWLQQAGEQTRLTVTGQAGFVLFTTYRPSDYATTGIRMDIERIKDQAAAPAGARQAPPQPTAPAPGFPQPGQAAQPAYAQPGQAGLSSLSLTPPGGQGFPGGQGMGFAPQAPLGMPQAGQPPFGGFGGPVPQPQAAQTSCAPQMPPYAAQAPAFGQPLPGPGGYAPVPGFAPAGPRPFTPPGQPAAAAPTAPAQSAPGIRMAAHIEGEGDVAFEPGQHAGKPGSRRRLEAVALYAEGVNLHDIEYAAVTYDGRLMPWVCPPQFTGTRGMGAPLLGFAARLTGEAANRYNIVYAGSFFTAGQANPQANGEFLKSTVQGDPLEALAVRLEPKG